MSKLARWGDAVRTLQWTRGLRAGVAVAAAMTMCHVLGLPIGWAALGAFEAILVDNGGPYRSRLMTIATLMVGGAAACVVGSVSSTPLIRYSPRSSGRSTGDNSVRSPLNTRVM